MADLARGEGARAHYLPSLAQPVRPDRDAAALGSLVRLIRQFRPHVVHTHTAKAGFLGRQAALMAGRRRPVIVHTYHGHVLEGYFGPLKTGLYRRLEHRMARSTDCLIGVSEATVDDLVRLGIAPREKFRVVPLGLDLSSFDVPNGSARDELRGELAIGGDSVLAVYVGRVVPIKRLDVLIRATAWARLNGGAVEVAIVGGGELRSELERLARELGIADAIRFLDYRRDLARIFAASDIAALSSDNEGTPVSLIEAAASGLPAVATDVGGVSEVVVPETGLVVPKGDGQALGNAMLTLAKDRTLRERMGAAARERSLARYGAERLVSDIVRLYGELLGSREER